MNDDDFPAPWRDLLLQAQGAPERILSLTGDGQDEARLQAAERLTDLGLFRIVTARRYVLTAAGLAALNKGANRKGRGSASGDHATSGNRSWWKKLFGRRR